MNQAVRAWAVWSATMAAIAIGCGSEVDASRPDPATTTSTGGYTTSTGSGATGGSGLQGGTGLQGGSGLEGGSGLAGGSGASGPTTCIFDQSDFDDGCRFAP